MSQLETPKQLCKTCGKETRACACYTTATKGWAIEEDQITPGEVIREKYQGLRCLGRGSSATVYLVRHVISDEFYAMKMLNANVPHIEEARSRFEREANAIGKLSHKNLVALYDFGMSSRGQPFFITDFVDGKSLYDLLKVEKRLNSARAARIFVEVCEAMQYAHDNGLIHRDLKPTNILLAKDADGVEIVRIVDFGIVKCIEPERKEQKLTQDGVVVGSPSYMSPEQCRGHALDSRTDIYSVGCLLYQVIAGKAPFDGKYPLEILMKQVTEPIPLISKEFPELQVDPQLEEIILKMLAKDPDERFQSMADLKAALLPFIV